jgi:probable rRNA maturation factor
LEQVRQELRVPEDGVTVQLISDRAMARLNWEFRQRRGPTDVLSFPAHALRPKKGRVRPVRHESLSESHGYLGDIAISAETAQRNARRCSRALPAELRLLILHGMIHLAGYDHETDHGQMERFEKRLRCRLGLST